MTATTELHRDPHGMRTTAPALHVVPGAREDRDDQEVAEDNR